MREGFYQVVSNGFAGYGLPAEAPVVYGFPIPMFLEGSDLTPLKENFDKIIYGLTQWQPKVTQKGVYPAPPVTVEGKDYQAALDSMNALFLKNSWGDGLPVQPPTEARVQWLLTGTDVAPDTVVAKVLPAGGVATVRGIAVNLAMAGGRPEYMPLLMAAVQAIADPKFQLQNVSPSTNSNYVVAVVNGPMSKDIRLNSGYGLLGPDSAHPTGQVVGRALALIIQNLGGAVPGIGAMELYGGMRTTNAVFAEDEAGLPKGWTSLAVERGFTKEDNVITVLPVSSAVNITIMQSDYKEADAAAMGYLYRIAGNINAPNMNVWSTGSNHTSPDFAPGLLLLPRTWAEQWSNLGWDEPKLKGWLRENTRVPWDELKQLGLTSFAKVSASAVEGQPAYITDTPEQFRIVVAGGAQSAHAYWMEVGKATDLVSKKITLPAKWNDLLKAAEADLGPIQAQ